MKSIPFAASPLRNRPVERVDAGLWSATSDVCHGRRHRQRPRGSENAVRLRRRHAAVLSSFGVLATFISGALTHRLLRASGVIVVVLGAVMINRGLILTGSGYDLHSVIGSVSRIAKTWGAQSSPPRRRNGRQPRRDHKRGLRRRRKRNPRRGLVRRSKP